MSEAKAKRPLLCRLAERLAGEREAAQREIFLCTGPDCCRREEGLAAWKHLNRRVKEEGLASAVAVKRAPCMNVCGEGPIAVVYPERTFYQKMNEKGLDAVVKSHLMEGTPSAKYAFQPPDDVKEPPHRTRG